MSIALGSVVGADFLFVLLLYVILTISYSLRLKRLVIVDCLTLAALYTLRIISGAEAVSLQLSFWLLAFSVFIFLSLAFAKRYAEIVVQSDEGKSAVSGRGYLISDALVLQVMGVSSGYISALVVALYLRSDDVVFLYTEPMVLWFQIPLLLFWISWVWLKAARGQMHDDPIVFAIKDHASLLVVGLSFIMLLCAATGLGM